MEVGECNFARACQLLRLDQVDLLKAPRGRGQELLATFDPPHASFPVPSSSGPESRRPAWPGATARPTNIRSPTRTIPVPGIAVRFKRGLVAFFYFSFVPFYVDYVSLRSASFAALCATMARY